MSDSPAPEKENPGNEQHNSSSQDLSGGAATGSSAQPKMATEDTASDSQPENSAHTAVQPNTENAAAESKKQPEAPAGALASIFNGCAAGGPILLFLILAFLVWGGFWQPGRGVYCPPESTFVSALLDCLATNQWLAPTGLEDKSWSIPQWPLFYWLAWLLSKVPHLQASGLILPALSAIAAIFILLGVWGLAIAAGFGRRAALAGGLIIISAPFFVPVAHFVGPMPMAAALMLLALAFFARGWRKPNAWFSLPLAFVLTGLAGLCGGVIYFAVPLLGSVCFLVWQARFHRAHAWDAIFGFALMLILVGGWLGWVSVSDKYNSYLARLFSGHMLLAWPPVPLWWRALIIGLAGILPWSLLVFTVSWPRVLGKSPATLSASRKDNASALVWLSVFWVCAFSPFMQLPPMAGLPLIFLMAVLLGRAFTKLSPLGNRTFFLIAALFVCVAGLIIMAAGIPATREWLFALLPFKIPQFLEPSLQAIKYLPIVGVLLLLTGLGGFLFARRYQQEGGLLYGALAAIIITQFAVFMIAPDLAHVKNGVLLNLEEIQARVAAAPHVESEPSGPAPAINEPVQGDPPNMATEEKSQENSKASAQPSAPEAPASPVAPEPDANQEGSAPLPDNHTTDDAIMEPDAATPPQPENSIPALPSEPSPQPDSAAETATPHAPEGTQPPAAEETIEKLPPSLPVPPEEQAPVTR